MEIQNKALRKSADFPGPSDYENNLNLNLKSSEKVSFTKQKRYSHLKHKKSS